VLLRPKDGITFVGFILPITFFKVINFSNIYILHIFKKTVCMVKCHLYWNVQNICSFW